MNQELVKALAALLAKQAQVAQQGSIITDKDRDEFIRAKTGGKFGWKDAAPLVDPSLSFDNVARSFGEGALGNYGTTIQAHMPEALGAGPNVAAVNKEKERAFKSEHPIASTLAHVGGNIATLALPWGKIAEALGIPVAAVAARMLPEASTVAGAAARGALAGGGVGAVEASSEGNGAADRLARAASGGAMGAATGAAGGAILGKLLGTFAPQNIATRRMTDMIAKSGGPAALEGAAGGMDAAGRGDVAMLGDLSPHAQQATDFAANNNPNTYSDLATKMNARQEGMGARLQGDVADLVGTPNAADKLAQLQASNKAWADKAYDELRTLNPEVPLGDVAPLTTQPKVSGAFAAANETGQVGTQTEPPYVASAPPSTGATAQIGQLLTGGSGAAPDPAMLSEKLQDPIMQQTLRAAGHGDLLDAALGTEGTNPSARSLLNLRDRLRGMASKQFASGDKDLGARLSSVHDALTEHLRSNLPGFSKINDEFAARKRLEEALQSGVEGWNETATRNMGSDLAKLKPQERALYRQGIASQLIDWLRNIPRNQNAAGRIVNTSDAMQDKLKAVFGDEATFDKYMARAKAEKTMATTKNAVGGSATHRRDAEAMFDPINNFLEHGTSMSPHSFWSAIIRHTTGKANQNAAEIMGKQLGTQGTDKIREMLQHLTTPSPVLNPSTLRAATAAPVSLFDQFTRQ